MANAQITLTAATCNPSPGDTFLVYLPNTSNPGDSGANVIWDFSSTASGPETIVPFSYDCSLPQPLSIGEISFDTAQLCSTLRLNDSNLVVFKQGTYPYHVVYDDTKLIAQYPLTYNLQTYIDSYTQHDQLGDGVTAETIISADAYGTLILPDSTYTDVLRVKTIETGQSFVYSLGDWIIYNYQKIYYNWYNSTNKLPLLSMGLFQYAYPAGVEVVEEREKVHIYPNPATDALNIQTENKGYGSCTITDNVGREVRHQSIHVKETVIDVASLPPGLYYVNLKGEQGTTVRKFMKL